MEPNVKKKPSDWLKEPRFARYVIRDADGWTRDNWEEEIDVYTFQRRLMLCTLDIGPMVVPKKPPLPGDENRIDVLAMQDPQPVIWNYDRRKT